MGYFLSILGFVKIVYHIVRCEGMEKIPKTL
jgi:hypothetical protein